MRCPVCHSSSWINKTPLRVCRKCGFTRADDNFYKIKPHGIYSDSYYLEGDYSNYELEKIALQRNFSSRLTLINHYLPKRKQLLEVGSAYGYFLDLAKKDYLVEGVEVNRSLARRVSLRTKIKVYPGDVCSQRFSHRYDGLVALDVIEHLPSPSKFLKLCNHIIRSRGYLFLETGDIESLLAKIQGNKWRLIHPPEHLNYFSASSLTRLLELANFTVKKISRVSFHRSFSQTLFRLCPNIYRFVPNCWLPILSRVTFPLNTFDLIFVVAQKNS